MTAHLRSFGVLVVSALSAALLCTPVAFAAMPNVSATPVVIDGKGKVREILRYTITITNTSSHLVTVYPWVTDVDTAEGSTGTSDLGGSQTKKLAESLARWIEVTRGAVDLLPGEEKEIPITVQVNVNAKPGVYHALVHLSEGSDRASAESDRNATQDVVVNIEVLEDINERLQLATFSPVKNIFSDKSAAFEYRIANTGNRGEVPRGKVRIFDRNGREVATIEANEKGERLEPSANALLSSVWAAGGSFGRYKAMLDLEYGSRGTLQDTVFFWMIPWGKLASMFLTLILASVIIAVIIHSRMTATRSPFAVATASPARPSRFRSLLSRFWDDDDDDLKEDEDPDTREDHHVNEMREITAPRPVHSKIPSREPAFRQTYLPEAASHTPSAPASHRVTLAKREKPAVPPHHVVNLRK